ncbi:MAG: hypothetical protein DMG65_16725 [Candidatus Angelobacter sp. Gp1-AA117]|nr:MAG: hypothetical protein DMG65_16725 [Candidatus Angelobacter sp. Gp1-AA117]
MKSLCIALLSVLMVLTTVALPKSDSTVPQSDAQKSFEKLKALVGSWQSDDPKRAFHVTFRVTSNGSAIMSEMDAPPDDMITMFHLDGDRLMVTHYCAAGNQPRMIGKMSPDGKTLEFDYLDATNLNNVQDGHMHRLVITMIDENHHSEDLIFHTKDGKKEIPVHFNMHRGQ